MSVVESAASLVREARRRSGLTQAQLATRAGVTQSVVSAYESGRRQPSLPMLLGLLRATGHALDASLVAIESGPAASMSGLLGRRVRDNASAVKAVAARHGVRDVGVFGSVARGAERAGSDVDLLIDVPDGMGLLGLGRLRQELEDLLGVEVDLVPRDGLKPGVREDVLADLVAL